MNNIVEIDAQFGERPHRLFKSKIPIPLDSPVSMSNQRASQSFASRKAGKTAVLANGKTLENRLRFHLYGCAQVEFSNGNYSEGGLNRDRNSDLKGHILVSGS